MSTPESDIVSLDVDESFWNQFYTVASLVVVGTRDGGGADNLAPKHMTTPMGWEVYFGFVCTPRHKTYRNAVRTGELTVSYPRPSQVVLASLAAAPRTGSPEGPKEKRSLDQLPTWRAEAVDALFLEDAYLFLECTVVRRVEELGGSSSSPERWGCTRARYWHTSRPTGYAAIDETRAFPFPAGFEQ